MQKNEDLLTIQEFCAYLKIGKTLAKKIINQPKCKFVLRVGRKVFVVKSILDSEISKCLKNKTNLLK